MVEIVFGWRIEPSKLQEMLQLNVEEFEEYVIKYCDYISYPEQRDYYAFGAEYLFIGAHYNIFLNNNAIEFGAVEYTAIKEKLKKIWQSMIVDDQEFIDFYFLNFNTPRYWMLELWE